MIISASRRTDIPAFYSDWFYNRIKKGFVYVRNPMNPHQISNVKLSPDIVDCIVFWTKNPKKMLSRLNEINQYNYYFQFTITPYYQKLETNVPHKTIVIDTFKQLADIIGPDRVIWRYDPIFLTDKISLNYHIKSFRNIACRLASYTKRCVIAFLTMYHKTERNMRTINTHTLTPNEIKYMLSQASAIAKGYGIELYSCSSDTDSAQQGVKQGMCIDKNLIESITGYCIDAKKDKNQRDKCHCIESIDIGEYDTCLHNCRYCYANNSYDNVTGKFAIHDPLSPLLTGNVSPYDIIKERKVCSFRKESLFGYRL